MLLAKHDAERETRMLEILDAIPEVAKSSFLGKAVDDKLFRELDSMLFDAYVIVAGGHLGWLCWQCPFATWADVDKTVVNINLLHVDEDSL